MQATIRRLGVMGAVGLALAGCSFDVATYTIGRYGEVKGVHVHLGCHDTYEVFDRPNLGSLVVVTNAVNEALVCDGSASLPRSARMRRIAELFLSETTERPKCSIVGQTELSPVHTEVTYRCAAGDEPRRPASRRRT